MVMLVGSQPSEDDPEDDDVWAIGYDESGGGNRPLILHWDGHLWSSRPAPPFDGGDADLYDVAPIARDDVWAVGYRQDPVSHLDRPFILHWQRGQWSEVPVPSYAPGEASLACVTALAPDNVWAMGRLYHDGTNEALVLRWDGAAWTQGPSLGLNAASSRVLDCLALAPREVYAVGWL